ncbi:MAG: 2-amino-4-hydroxy-6-hydroxymethyldihydropteridine diphosphokinase [Bacteroidota bacterium]|jgi:2-amino-4-hydroxy-6-hydroxymethyldihydropteridine diphosphokinase
MQNNVFLLLGSNQGDREGNLLKACAGITKRVGNIVNRSSVYETEPWGFEDSTLFYNQALEIETELSPERMLEEIHGIEAGLGRVREAPSCYSGCACSTEYSSRTIDIDILFYGSKIHFTEDLMIPHPRLHERKFTLLPLDEIAPGFMHPVYHKTISGLLADCIDDGGVTRLLL